MEGGDESGTVVVVFDGDVEVVVGRLGCGRPDLAVVDALARLQLVAGRLGCSVHLRDPSTELCELLDLVGLADLLVGPGDLGLDAGREAEGGEQLRVEEAVEPGDPPG